MTLASLLTFRRSHHTTRNQSKAEERMFNKLFGETWLIRCMHFELKPDEMPSSEAITRSLLRSYVSHLHCANLRVETLRGILYH